MDNSLSKIDRKYSGSKKNDNSSESSEDESEFIENNSSDEETKNENNTKRTVFEKLFGRGWSNKTTKGKNTFVWRRIKSKRHSDTRWILQDGTLTMFVSEIIGTAVLIFIGCMGCIGTLGPSPPPPMQMALTFGLTVNMIIMMLGHISGAHLNPAVTIGAVIIGLKSIPTGAIYIVGQFCGATAGYGLLKLVTPSELFSDGNINSTVPLCVTAIHPDVTKVQAILIEAFCTGIILCTACATWDPRCAHTTDSTAIRFGLAVAGISFAASPFTGCSMNPARTFGPALWNGAWTDQWVYWVGPVLGALLGTYTYQVFFHEPKEKSREYNLPSNNLELSTIDIQDAKS